MIFTGDNGEHMKRSLVGTVVWMKKGEPCYIQSIMKGKVGVKTNVQLLKHFDEDANEPIPFEEVKLDDLDLNRPLNLGFVNKKGHLYLAKRQPRRQYRVGLTNENTRILGLRGEPQVNVVSSALRNTLKLNYPEIGYIVETMNRHLSKGGAFSRHFAVIDKGMDYLLYRLDVSVGTVSREGVPKLNPKFIFLKEELTKELGE